MEEEIAEIRYSCDRVEQLNCLCWEKEYREVANERLEKYGRRGPSTDALAWKNVP